MTFLCLSSVLLLIHLQTFALCIFHDGEARHLCGFIKKKKIVVACNPLWKEGDRDVSFCRADHNIDGPLFFSPNNILGTSACFVDTDYQVVTVVLVVRPLPLTPAVVSTLLTPLPVSCPLTTPLHYNFGAASRMSGATRDHSRLSDHGPDRSRQP